MKKLILLTALIAGFAASAQDYKGHYGFGLALGEPSGFSIKKFNNSAQAFQYTLGYSLVQGQQGINVGVDYLLHNYDFITAEKGAIAFYYGLGAHLKSYNQTMVYARVPLGLTYEFHDLPLDVFFEFAPGVSVLPSPGLVANFGIGGRVYFDFRKAVEKLDEAI